MKYFLVLILVGLLLGAAPTGAQSVCGGYVQRVPLGLGLPVMAEPAWESSFTGRNLQAGEQVAVYATHYRPGVGDIWFQLDGGWAQAYSGYTTGFSQLILTDYPCAQTLTHTVGD